MASKYLDVFKKAISLNVPLRFSYNSKRSPFFPTGQQENPAHDRVVQPVVIGTKTWGNKGTGVYFRGYLLNDYSYSRNRYFNTEITNKARTPRYWRLYDVSKMKNVRIVSDFPKEKRFYPRKHREYNPRDKFFTAIQYAMDSNYEYSYFFNGKEESETKVTQYVRALMRENRIVFKKPVRFYEISENEEVGGFFDEKSTWINTVWASQASRRQIINGLKNLVGGN